MQIEAVTEVYGKHGTFIRNCTFSEAYCWERSFQDRLRHFAVPQTFETRTESLKFNLVETDKTFAPVFDRETHPARKTPSYSHSNALYPTKPFFYTDS